MSTNITPLSNEVALIAGPTASGKSDLAVRLALALHEHGRGAVVINADSAQVYGDLAIVSARPCVADMHGIEHRLFGSWDGAQACSAADWASAARAEVAEAQARGAVPILVGGTGLYIRTLLDGIAPIPAIEPAIRAQVRDMAVEDAYAALCMEDPQRAAQLDPADSQRICRALEVVRSTGRSMKAFHDQLEGGIAGQIALAPLILLPDRELLFSRCDARFELMLESGAAEEVQALLARDLPEDLPVMRAIGVREIAAWLTGDISREEAIARGAQSTRNYAKRQYTWFRNQPPKDWPRLNPESVDIHAVFETLFQH